MQKLTTLPIYEWNYKGENQKPRHLGPMAQDFYRIFSYGNDTVSISTIDPTGVALVAIQELVKQNALLKEQIQQLKNQQHQQAAEIQWLKQQLLPTTANK